MVFGKVTDPRADERRDRVNNFSNFKNQISIGLNMTVSVFAMFGMGYYICLQMNYGEKTSLIVGLIAAVLIMFIEMVLFIFRAVRIEDNLERKLDDGAGLNVELANFNDKTEYSVNDIVFAAKASDDISSDMEVVAKNPDLLTKKNQ